MSDNNFTADQLSWISRAASTEMRHDNFDELSERYQDMVIDIKRKAHALYSSEMLLPEVVDE